MLAHSGGPFWAKKEEGAWSVPKGVLEANEDPLEAAKREFREETGHAIEGNFVDLGELKQPSGKIVHVWTVESDFDVEAIESNTFALEWPKNSGNIKNFPEIDRAQWFEIHQAKTKIVKGQAGFIDRLEEIVGKIKE
jgi:predicted NUDIX family NTP pyrophosphohydrolase